MGEIGCSRSSPHRLRFWSSLAVAFSIICQISSHTQQISQGAVLLNTVASEIGFPSCLAVRRRYLVLTNILAYFEESTEEPSVKQGC